MKPLIFISILFCSLFFSCSKQETVPLVSSSADNKLSISVSGTRSSALDPWMLEVAVNDEGTIDKVYQEFYADAVTDENVRFEWKSNNECIIHLTQRDGAKIDIPVQIQK